MKDKSNASTTGWLFLSCDLQIIKLTHTTSFTTIKPPLRQQIMQSVVTSLTHPCRQNTDKSPIHCNESLGNVPKYSQQQQYAKQIWASRSKREELICNKKKKIFLKHTPRVRSTGRMENTVKRWVVTWGWRNKNYIFQANRLFSCWNQQGISYNFPWNCVPMVVS
jgi:hypothetical protein